MGARPQFARMTASHACAICGTPVAMSVDRDLSTARPVLCDRAGCRLRAARRQWQALRYEAEARRSAALSRCADGRADGVDPVPVPVALVPRHRAPIRPAVARRQRTFEATLRGLVAFVRTHGPEHDDPTLDHPAALDGPSAALVAATCAACRGACCANGGEHAFLRSRTIREVLAAHPTWNDDDVIEAYLAHLPARAMQGGCVYQGAHGCTLPREMRSAICNAYLCAGLKTALAEAAAVPPLGVFVAHREGERVTATRLRWLPVVATAEPRAG